jgi:hypothetical protein
MNVIGNGADQECGRWLNNRAENSHQPFRRREQAMAKFRDMKTLQKFASVHASLHNHFNQDRHLNRRDIFKQNRAAALAEWRQLAAWGRVHHDLRIPVRFPLTAPFRAISPDKPNRWINFGIALRWYQFAPELAYDVVANDLDGKILNFPVGHFDLSLRNEDDWIQRLAGIIVDQPPSRKFRFPSRSGSAHWHSAWDTTTAFGDCSKTTQVAGTTHISIHVIYSNKEKLVPHPEWEVFQERWGQVCFEPA